MAEQGDTTGSETSFECPAHKDDGTVSSISGSTLYKAIKELNEDPERRIELIQDLREKINHLESNPLEQEHRFVRKDDKFLLCFLRARKFDTARAFQLYINYHKYRHKYSHMLQDYTIKSVEYLVKDGIFGLLDQRLNDSSKALCFFPGRYDIYNIPVSEILKAGLLIMDRLVEDEEIQVHGVSLVEDMDGVSFHHVMTLVATDIMQKAVFIELIQDAFPIRFKSCHLIRQPWYFSFVYALIRPFLKQKLRDRVHMHGWDLTRFHEFADVKHLPEDFGGDLPPLPYGTLTKLFPDQL